MQMCRTIIIIIRMFIGDDDDDIQQQIENRHKYTKLY